MFTQFAASIPGGANALFQAHPAELALLLEQAWVLRKDDPNQPLGHPLHRSDLDGLSVLFPNLPATTTNLRRFGGQVQWHHLIYAYMIENSGIYEIFGKVLHEFLHGEQLGVPLPGSEQWLRTTEELFYKNPAPFHITAIASHTRPDLRASRRNAYYRMFGMDLDLGQGGKETHPYVKAEARNDGFVDTLNKLLDEVWIGIKHVGNTTSERPIRDAAIAEYAEKLHDMMRSRRNSGNLSREEFYAVSTMSWFDLTLRYDSPIVQSLRAEATSPEQRLFKIAERVKLAAADKTRAFFQLAEPMSRILTLIETGAVNTSASVPALYTPPSQIESDMNTIITQWRIAVRRDKRTNEAGAST
jgi:hypothetical protein